MRPLFLCTMHCTVSLLSPVVQLVSGDVDNSMVLALGINGCGSKCLKYAGVLFYPFFITERLCPSLVCVTGACMMCQSINQSI